MNLSQIVAIALTAISTTSAVTLQQFTRHSCRGRRYLCTRIDPGVCCAATTRAFVSGSCVGCTDTDFHMVWTKDRLRYCGRVAESVNGGGCIGSQSLGGHSWCRLRNTKRMADRGISGDLLEDIEKRGNEAADTCTAPDNDSKCEKWVEPDLMTIDGRYYFNINYKVPKTDTTLLLKWMNSKKPRYSTLPRRLRESRKHKTKLDLSA